MILHFDADAFFASVEQAADPKLRCRPVAVGGERRGIIASASYEARKLGIYTPMPTARAKKLCPNLIVLPEDADEVVIPPTFTARPSSSTSELQSPNASIRKPVPRITTAHAIAATRDAKKRWCGAHAAAANGDLMRLKAYIDASDGSPKRNVTICSASATTTTLINCRFTTSRSSVPTPSSRLLRVVTWLQ